MSDPSDFIIENGVLKKYKGPGGDVIIPEGVTNIGYGAFEYCRSLTSVTIPGSVTSIGYGAFQGCSSLTSVTVPEGVTSIGYSAFSHCSSLTSVIIPDSVTSIGNQAFWNCSSLTSVTIPDSVTSIGNQAFSRCSSLTSVTIPDSVTSIGDEAFQWCSGLTSVTIPDSVTRIGDGAFYDCSRLKSVTIPDGVTSIGNGAFNGCSGLADADGFVIVKEILFDYKGSGGDVVIPNSVTSIGYLAFSCCSNLTSVTIPDSVTSIGDYAFSRCSSLTNVTIPDSVTSIGKEAFEDCGKLETVNISDLRAWCKIKYGGGAFSHAYRLCLNGKSLQELVIPDSVTSIGDSAFFHCGSLTSVTVPDGVTSIGDYAFYSCSSLTSVTIPDSVTSIGDSAFYYCSSLTSVTIPDSVTSIGNRAFYGCGNVRFIGSAETLESLRQSFFQIENGILEKYHGPGGDVTIPKSVTSIGDWAFSGCSSLTSVTIPDSVTSIGDEAFSDCSGLRELCVSKKLKSLGKNSFGGLLPKGLVPQLGTFYFALTDGTLKEAVLDKSVWGLLDMGMRVTLFLQRHSKSLIDAYWKSMDAETAEQIRLALLDRLTGKASVGDCGTAALFLTSFFEIVEPEKLRELYTHLKSEKNGGKALKTVEEHVSLMEKIDSAVQMAADISPLKQKVRDLLTKEKKYAKDLEIKLKQYYMLSITEMPKLLTADGKEAEPQALAWLLTAHERLQTHDYGLPDVLIDYEKPGLRPEAAELVALLDPKSLQAALKRLAYGNLGPYQNPKNKFLAYPICRYADEATMAELTRYAPKWASSVSGKDTPSLYTIRQAALYSDTRSAMLFAEKMGDLDDYAKLRGMDADTLRDTVLADFGLDEAGKKVYDLGAGTLTVSMAPDLTLSLFDNRTGKAVKSVPKKNADPEKYEAAKKDLDELKKNVKKVVKLRKDRLLAAFLDGERFKAASWTTVYTKNPVLNAVARLLVWVQEDRTFTLGDGGPIDSQGLPYTITDKPIKIAHPMEMKPEETAAWQKYFTHRALKQPFAQVWEPVIPGGTVKEDRYKGCMIPYYRFVGQEKHGITVEDNNFHNEIYISFKNCGVEVERIDWERHAISMNHRFEVKKFSFRRYNRRVNHYVAYLDRITVWDRVKKDDVSVMDWMGSFTLAQITEFIQTAQEAQAVNILALLLEYKNAHFADFDPMDEFTLEW